MYVAILLKSESADYYQYLINADTAEGVLDELLRQNNELEDGYISEYFVESNDEIFNKQVNKALRQYIDSV